MKINIKNIDDIFINKDYYINFLEFLSKDEGEKQTFFKNIFISIIKDNSNNNTFIKLVDIKKKYSDNSEENLRQSKSFQQILKNTIGSNKDNKPHLLRDPRIFWYFSANSPKQYIDVDEEERKPFPLPRKLERSHSKKYYVRYSQIADDSVVETFIEEIESLPISDEINYNDIDFNNIKENKINYIQKQKIVQDIGNFGEKFVLKEEEKLLKKMKIKEKPVWVAKKSDSYGFDILSFRKGQNGIYRIYIEVKTTTGDISAQFYMSKKEISISRRYDKNYYLYRVYNAGDKKTTAYKIYVGNIEQNEKIDKVSVTQTTSYIAK